MINISMYNVRQNKEVKKKNKSMQVMLRRLKLF